MLGRHQAERPIPRGSVHIRERLQAKAKKFSTDANNSTDSIPAPEGSGYYDPMLYKLSGNKSDNVYFLDLNHVNHNMVKSFAKIDEKLLTLCNLEELSLTPINIVPSTSITMDCPYSFLGNVKFYEKVGNLDRHEAALVKSCVMQEVTAGCKQNLNTISGIIGGVLGGGILAATCFFKRKKIKTCLQREATPVIPRASV